MVGTDGGPGGKDRRVGLGMELRSSRTPLAENLNRVIITHQHVHIGWERDAIAMPGHPGAGRNLSGHRKGHESDLVMARW